MRKEPIVISFSPEEADIVAEALNQFQSDKPAERLKAVRMRDLIDGELGKGRKQ